MQPVSVSNTKQFFDAGQQQLNQDRYPVTLYFIGYRLLREGGELPRFPVKGRTIQAPPIGESIVLDNVIAKDLMSRSAVYDPRHGWIQSFTEDADLAKAVASAVQAGELTADRGLDVLRKIIRQSDLSTLSQEELEAELARRQTAAPEEEDKSTSSRAKSKGA
jgi:hypothetical protein